MVNELVTIEHDEYGVYVFGSPYAKKTLLPHVKRLHRFDYLIGDTKPNYPLPVTIGLMETRYGTYLFDTRDRTDGMPLFRGYTREQWLIGDTKPNYPLPTIRECPWCHSKHLGHSHFVANGLVIPN